MATTVHTSVQLGNAEQVAAWLGSMFPHYKTQTRGKKVVVIGSGAATGIGVVLRGPQQVRINWQFPSVGVQILLVLGIVFSLLLGAIAFLIVWLSVKDDVKRIEQEVTAALQGGWPHQAHPGAYPQALAGQYPQALPGQYPQPQPGQYPPQPGQYHPPQPNPYPQAQPGQHPPPQPGQHHPGYPG